MTETQIPIDPTRPVGGNFKGSFAGFVSMGITGWLAKQGIIKTCAAYMCVPDATDQFLSCGEMEFYIAVFLIASIGSFVNFMVTRNAQVANLKIWWDRIPKIEISYPGDRRKSDQPPSVGMENGNFNKP